MNAVIPIVAAILYAAFQFSVLLYPEALGYMQWPELGIQQALTLASWVLAAVSLAWRTPAPFSKWWVAAAWALPGAILLSSFATQFRAAAAIQMLHPMAGIALGIVTARWLAAIVDEERRRTRLILAFGLVVACATVLAAVGGVQWIEEWQRQQNVRGEIARLTGLPVAPVHLWDVANNFPVGYTNTLAGIAMLATGAAVSATFAAHGRLRWLFLSAALAGAAWVFSTQSRAGVLGLLLLAGGIAALALTSAGAATRRRTVRIVPGSLIAAACVLAAAAATQPRLRNLLGRMASGDFYDVRFDYARTALPMGAAYPIAGVGPGGSTFHYPLFWDGHGTGFNAYQLHSIPLQVWAELGLVGIAACALLLWALWRSRSHVAHGGGSALFLPFIGYLPLALSDYHLNTAPAAAALGVLCGLVAGFSAGDPAPATRRKDGKTRPLKGAARRFPFAHPAPMAASGAAVMSVLLLQAPVSRGRALQAEADEALAQSDLPKFEATMAQAISASPSDLSLRHRLGAELALAARSGSGSVSAQEALQSACNALEGSLERWEPDPFANAYLGWVRLLQGDASGALPRLARAARLSPRMPRLGYAMAVCYGTSGQTDELQLCLAGECLSDPSFISASYWHDQYKAIQPAVLSFLASFLPSENAHDVAGLAGWMWQHSGQPPVLYEEAIEHSERLRTAKSVRNGPSSPVDRGSEPLREFIDPLALLLCARGQPPETRRALIEGAFLLAKAPPPSEQDMAVLLAGTADISSPHAQWLQSCLAGGTPGWARRTGNAMPMYGHLVHNTARRRPAIPVDITNNIGIIAPLLPPWPAPPPAAALKSLYGKLR